MYYIYILYSPSSDRYYVGYTADINRRLQEHNEQERFSTYTSKHRPWVLKVLFACGEENEARKHEKFIKRNHSRKLLERLIDPNWKPEGKLAQLVKVPHMRD